MAQVFSSSANNIARMSIILGGLLVVVLGGVASAFYRSPYVNQVRVAKDQPIPFSHARHVGANGIDCRYCHTSVEESAYAGVPSVEVCMTCHSQILPDNQQFKPLWDAWKEGKPVKWVRLHDVPDFVYFNHSIHISKGVGCSTCHGKVDEMPLTWKVNHMSMGWCLQCHRNPEKYVRPLDKIYDLDWAPGPEQLALGADLVHEYEIEKAQLTNCSVCHR